MPVPSVWIARSTTVVEAEPSTATGHASTANELRNGTHPPRATLWPHVQHAASHPFHFKTPIQCGLTTV